MDQAINQQTKCLLGDRTFSIIRSAKTAECEDHAFAPRVLAISATLGLPLSAGQIQSVGKPR